jgi:CO dehydrogenase/acetyl-CoA synthase epsilon subunit
MKIKFRTGAQATAGLLLVPLVLAALVFAPLASAHDGGIEQGIDADTARYTAMGRFYQDGTQRGIDADTARYTAMGQFYQDRLQRALDADTARYTAMGEFYQDRLQRALDADTAHYVALGRYYSGLPVAGVDGENHLTANPELFTHIRYQTCGC